MQNLDEKLIFDRVRTILEEYQPESSSSNWSNMSALLDKQSLVVKPSRRNDLFIGFICGVIVTIIFIGAIYFYQVEKTSVSQKTSATNVATSNIKLDVQPIIQYSKPKNLTTKNERVQIQVVSSVADVSNLDISNLPEDKNGVLSKADDIENIISTRTINRTSDFDQDKLDNPLFPKKISPKVIDFNAYNKIKHENIVGLSFNERIIVKKSEKKEDKSKFITINWDLFKGSFRFQDDMYKRIVGPDRIRLGYLPEITIGSFQDKAGVGQGIGIELEGPISRRVYVGLGFNLRQYSWSKEQRFESLKRIEIPDSSYQYVVDSIHQWKGDWRYFEIPISLKLHFIEIGKSKIFLNFYLAAIIMQSESYEYNRIINTDIFTQKDNPAPFSNFDILGNIRIGLEYRYYINRRWNLYFEPYYKLTLSGIGKTDFKPRGFGINFGLIYQFNLHNEK